MPMRFDIDSAVRGCPSMRVAQLVIDSLLGSLALALEIVGPE